MAEVRRREISGCYGNKSELRLAACSITITQIMLIAVIILFSTFNSAAWSRNLEEIIKVGKLRHLGIPYANFVTDDKIGLDVELMRMFSAYLGVEYEFIETDWQNVLSDLTGEPVTTHDSRIKMIDKKPVRGDVIATGFTVLAWREKFVDFSETTFPTGVWLIARADSPVKPIIPTGVISQDIGSVKKNLSGISVLTLKNSCLDPDLYRLNETGADVKRLSLNAGLDQMFPAVMAKMADTSLIDVPAALIALEKWPGKIKVIGPVSHHQRMACAFPKSSPNLRQKFNEFFHHCKTNGTYRKLVYKYYPTIFTYYPDFLSD